MNEDADLLRQYATSRDQDAFARLVSRHVDLVYSVALRTANGDAHAARDISQVVFTALAREAAPLSRRPVLSGWLYRTAQFTAAKYVRTESRRRAREQEAQTMNEINAEPAAEINWDAVRPVVDTAMAELNDRDRDALVLRYIENRSFAEVGHCFQLTADAARMRTDRALEKLRSDLGRRGIRSTSAALALGLASEISSAAPAGLSAALATGAASAASAAPTFLESIALMSSFSSKFAVLALVGSTAVGGAYFYHSKSEGNVSTPARKASAPAAPFSAIGAGNSPPTVAVEPPKRMTVAEILEQLRAADAIPDAEARKLRVLALHKAWSEIDAGAALNSASVRGSDIGYAILEDVTVRDPDQVWRWISNLPTNFNQDGFYTAEAYRRIMGTMARNGAGALASTYVDSMAPARSSPFTDEAARELAAVWALTSPLEVAQWLQRVTDREAIGSAAQAFGTVLAAGDLASIQRYIAMQDDRAGNLILAGATREWVKSGEAFRIAEYSTANPQLPDSQHDTILSAMSQIVGKDDPAAARAMILEIRNPAERDRWLWNSASESMSRDPVQSMMSALEISNPTQRENRVAAIYSQWAKADPTAANAYASSPSFPPELARVVAGAVALNAAIANDPESIRLNQKAADLKVATFLSAQEAAARAMQKAQDDALLRKREAELKAASGSN